MNGEGNLVLGYAENANGYAQTGSHDLVVGKNNGWSSFGEVVGGNTNRATGNYAAVFGKTNVASGGSSFAAGESQHRLRRSPPSVAGGAHNVASGGRCRASPAGGSTSPRDPFASVAGGCENLAGSGSGRSGSCGSSGAEAVLGGFENTASGLESTISGGEVGAASGGAASVAGGQFNGASGGAASVAGGDSNTASGSLRIDPRRVRELRDDVRGHGQRR